MKRNRSIGLVAVIALLLSSSAALGGRKDPNNAPDQLAFGVQMAKRGLWSEALFRFKQAERLRPGDPRVLNNMAVAFEDGSDLRRRRIRRRSSIPAEPKKPWITEELHMRSHRPKSKRPR
ncbi:MAG: hypothetical protein V3T72_06505, partial [Thermoanaerobaculia bacterium]